MLNDEAQRFAISAEKRGYPRALIMMDLSFAALIDTVIKPYEEDEAFFIDGVPLTRGDVERLKVVEQTPQFAEVYRHVQNDLLGYRGEKEKEISLRHYDAMIADIFRGHGRDVTSLVVRAYGSEVKPSLPQYLPKRDVLVQGAYAVFTELLKALR